MPLGTALARDPTARTYVELARHLEGDRLDELDVGACRAKAQALFYELALAGTSRGFGPSTRGIPVLRKSSPFGRRPGAVSERLITSRRAHVGFLSPLILH